MKVVLLCIELSFSYIYTERNISKPFIRQLKNFKRKKIKSRNQTTMEFNYIGRLILIEIENEELKQKINYCVYNDRFETIQKSSALKIMNSCIMSLKTKTKRK